jgi:hypothetical protein
MSSECSGVRTAMDRKALVHSHKRKAKGGRWREEEKEDFAHDMECRR